jgi:dihydroneopterin aldolase
VALLHVQRIHLNEFRLYSYRGLEQLQERTEQSIILSASMGWMDAEKMEVRIQQHEDIAIFIIRRAKIIY